MAASFSHSAGTLTLSRGPERPAHVFTLTQAELQSVGAEIFAWQWYVKKDLITLPVRLTIAEKAGLLAFFRDTVEGQKKPFTYTDPCGNAVTVRFATASLPEIRERLYNAYRADLQLRIIL